MDYYKTFLLNKFYQNTLPITNNNKKICKEDIQKFHKLLSNKTEICGNLILHNNCLISDEKNEVIGYEISESVGTCNHKTYTKYIFHTHPLHTKSYPSREDIINVLKHNEIEYSIIFTRWGIWNIWCSEKIRDGLAKKYQKFIETKEFDIYKLDKTQKEFTENHVKIINNYIEILEKRFHKYKLLISFSEWNLEQSYENPEGFPRNFARRNSYQLLEH